MSITINELDRYLSQLLEPERFNEGAYNGVQITTKAPITKVATAVSVSTEVIQKAIELKAQALIVHHGLFLKKSEHPLVGRLYDMVAELIRHDIALLCYHLPLDAHPTLGNNGKAAHDLGLTDQELFLEWGGSPIGVVGTMPPVSFDAFKIKVEEYYGRPAQFVKVKDQVSKVAIISGGADKFIMQAAEVGADCFITGRVDEQVWDDAHDYGVSFLGLGHYGTETIGVKELAKVLEEQFKIPAEFIQTNNPF